jgi:Septum formation
MRDDRRENERYRHERLVDQVRDELRNLRRQPKLLLLLGLIVGGWAVLQLMQPPVAQLESLRTGDCIYIPTSTGGQVDSGRAIGTQAEAATGLVLAGAERAPCDGSHSHEVADTFTLTGQVGDPFPGFDVLNAREQTACGTAFAAYVGHPVAGSRFELTLVVPTQAAWDKGRRAGACLVSNADGTFLGSLARGSGA